MLKLTEREGHTEEYWLEVVAVYVQQYARAKIVQTMPAFPSNLRLKVHYTIASPQTIILLRCESNYTRAINILRD